VKSEEKREKRKEKREKRKEERGKRKEERGKRKEKEVEKVEKAQEKKNGRSVQMDGKQEAAGSSNTQRRSRAHTTLLQMVHMHRLPCVSSFFTPERRTIHAMGQTGIYIFLFFFFFFFFFLLLLFSSYASFNWDPFQWPSQWDQHPLSGAYLHPKYPSHPRRRKTTLFKCVPEKGPSFFSIHVQREQSEEVGTLITLTQGSVTHPPNISVYSSFCLLCVHASHLSNIS
jgi:hypothetical protein